MNPTEDEDGHSHGPLVDPFVAAPPRAEPVTVYPALLERFETAEAYIRLRDVIRLAVSVGLEPAPHVAHHLTYLEARLDELDPQPNPKPRPPAPPTDGLDADTVPPVVAKRPVETAEVAFPGWVRP